MNSPHPLLSFILGVALGGATIGLVSMFQGLIIPQLKGRAIRNRSTALKSNRCPKHPSIAWLIP